MRRYKAYKMKKANKKTRVVFNSVDITKATDVNLVPEMKGSMDFERGGR